MDTTEPQHERIYAAEILLKIMKPIGLWQWLPPNASVEPYMATTVQLLQYGQRLLLQVPFTFIFFTLMWYEVMQATDIDQVGDVIYMSLAGAALILKVLNIWKYSIEALNFIATLKDSPQFALRTVQEVEFWRRSQRRFRYIIYLYGTGSCITVVSAFLGVLVMEEPQLAFPYWVPFEWKTVRRNYWLAYFLNMMGMACGATTSVCLDMLGCYFLFHVSLLYRILRFRLQKFNDVPGENVESKLQSIFKFHKLIRRMTKECELISANFVMAQIILSALILCFCCYRIQKMEIAENFPQFLSMLQFLAVMFLQIFLPCYFGNEITVNSAKLPTDLYNINWLEFSVSNRKLLVLFQEFLKRPDKVTIFGYFDVGLPVFTKVMNNAYSVFALLMNVEK
uniref:Odorant receptor n=1 Tax=Stomoxys calcitrans TaxID=35570 RepID=A0A1I8QB88_STOCA